MSSVESTRDSDCLELINLFKKGDEDTLVEFLANKASTGFVREPCIPASVYKQEPNCPAGFPPNDENLTPLQWLAIFMTSDGMVSEAVDYYMSETIQSYSADGKGKGDYKDCFFKGPIQGEKALDYSPVVLACIFNNSKFLWMVNISCDNDYTLWDTRYKPLVQDTARLYQCDVREFKPLQIASLLGSDKVANFLARDLNVFVNQKPDDRDQGRYGSSWAKFNPLTLSIVGFGLPLEDWDPVSRAVRPTRTRNEYIESIESLLGDEFAKINTPDVNVSIINWSAMYELIHNAFGKEYTKGSEQDLFNKEVFELFLPIRYSKRINPDTLKSETIKIENVNFSISAPEVLQGLDRSSNLSARKKDQTPSPVSEAEKIRRRFFIYDKLLKQRYLLRPKIEEIPLRKLILKNVEETLPDMLDDLLRDDKYMNRYTIARDRIKREQGTIDRIEGSEEIGTDAREKIKKYISIKGGKRKTRKIKTQRGGYETLLDFAENGNLDAMNTELSSPYSDVDMTDKWGQTPLYKSSRKGHLAAVKLLLDAGADVNKSDNGGYTPLHESSYAGHKEVMKALLNKGADVNKRANSGDTALHRAAMQGHADVVKLLLDDGARVNIIFRSPEHGKVTPIFYAAEAQKFYKGDPESVPLLLRKAIGEEGYTLEQGKADELDMNSAHTQLFGELKGVKRVENKFTDRTVLPKNAILGYLGGKRKTKKKKRRLSRKRHSIKTRKRRRKATRRKRKAKK